MHLSFLIIPTLLLTLLPSTPISAIPITTNPIDISARDVPPLPGPNPEPTCPTLPRTPHDKEITQGKYLKITMLVRKHVDVTDDYFHKYWTKCDVPLALDCPAFTENVVRYTSVRVISLPQFPVASGSPFDFIHDVERARKTNKL